MIRFLSWGLALLLVGSLHLGAQERELVVYYNQRPPLYSSGDDGFLTEITKLILEDAGIPFRLVEAPSQRILVLLQEGVEYATGIGWFRTPEREAWAHFSQPFYQDLPQVLVGRREKLALLGVSPSLEKTLAKGLVLGRKTGYSFGPFIDEKIKTLGARVQETTMEIPQLLTMISRGRMDYTILGLEEARHLLDRDENLENLAILALANPPAGNLRHFLVSRAVPLAVVDQINASIDRVVTSEAYLTLTESLLRSPL